jgi:selenocysteine lyase/cysteine desulfurase
VWLNADVDKREFLRTIGGSTLAAWLGERAWARWSALAPTALAQDEAFWTAIRAKYLLATEYINLENGYYSMQSQDVLEAFVGHVREVNFGAARYMRTRQANDKLAVRTELAELAGCKATELIITRNTTESLDTVIAGQEWRAGDEAVMSRHDYGSMLDMFALQARRHRIRNRVVTVPLDPKSDDEVVDVYRAAITDKTRLVMVCHILNVTGQILPVQKIADMAHEKGAAVMVDGAHAFAQLDFKIPDLHCDYYGASLHKWLGAPLGAGLLYVRSDRVKDLWPMFADSSVPDADIGKLNHTGTHPAHTDLAIREAIAFHRSIGSARKEARLRFLQQYWTNAVRGTLNIVLNTPADPARSCAIANVGVTTKKPLDLQQALFDRYRIFTVAIDSEGVRGVRITPHVYTTTAELDALVKALKELAAA